MSQFLRQHGLVEPANPKALYSNIGFGLLGYALALGANVSYAQLLETEITGPLRMDDTVISLSEVQRERMIRGYNSSFAPTGPFDFRDVSVGAGAIKSDAHDMLTYLDANLHPEKYAMGVAPGSPAATLPSAFALVRNPPGERKGLNLPLAWGFDPKARSFEHEGGTFGAGSYAALILNATWRSWHSTIAGVLSLASWIEWDRTFTS